MRLTDDYLFISSDKSNVIQLIEELQKSAIQYGFKFNTDKIHTNLPLHHNHPLNPHSTSLNQSNLPLTPLLLL